MKLSDEAIRCLKATEFPGVERIPDFVAGKIDLDTELIHAIDFAIGFLWHGVEMKADSRTLRRAWEDYRWTLAYRASNKNNLNETERRTHG